MIRVWVLVGGGVLGAACLSGTWQQRRAASLEQARHELVTFGWCLPRRVATCSNDVRVLTTSDTYSWSSSFFERDRLVGEAWGSCTFSDSRGRVLPCEADAGMEELCEVALRDVVMTGVLMTTWPDGGPSSRALEFGPQLVAFDHFTLAVEVPRHVGDLVRLTLARIDEGYRLRPTFEDSVRLGAPLEVGDELPEREVVLEARDGGLEPVRSSFSPRFGLPDGGR